VARENNFGVNSAASAISAVVVVFWNSCLPTTTPIQTVVDLNPQLFQLFLWLSDKPLLRASSGMIRSLAFLMSLRAVVTFFFGALTTTTTPEPGKHLAGLQEVL
jgi:hypothetical protein